MAAINPERILLIKPSAIGDVVHGLPVLNLIRRKWPSAHIAWLVTPGCAGVIEGHPHLDEIILFDRRYFGQGWRDVRALIDLWKFARNLRKKKFDLVVDLQGLLRSGWLAWETGAKCRIGFAKAREWAWVFYTDRVVEEDEKKAARNGGRHAVERNLDLAEALGCGRSPVEFDLAIGDAERAWVDEIIGGRKSYALLVPGTLWETKQWPVERFAGLAKMIRERFGLVVIAAGASDEVELANQVGAGLNLAGKTSLKQLIALIARAKLVVANDSGPMHIAAALGRPLVTMFGPTNPELTGPFGRMDSVVRLDIPCSPCYSRKCSHQSCLRLLDEKAVADVIEKQIERTSIV